MSTSWLLKANHGRLHRGLYEYLASGWDLCRFYTKKSNQFPANTRRCLHVFLAIYSCRASVADDGSTVKPTQNQCVLGSAKEDLFTRIIKLLCSSLLFFSAWIFLFLRSDGLGLIFKFESRIHLSFRGRSKCKFSRPNRLHPPHRFPWQYINLLE